ncbi:MAG TPA: hypothetical protein VJN90_04220 [Candidatus Acidoferrales bacterium]|nr:hypothetical protein [Candidatus Acidoferrales bacterium]
MTSAINTAAAARNLEFDNVRRLDVREAVVYSGVFFIADSSMRSARKRMRPAATIS